MSKNLIYLLALVFSLGLSFSACSDDDDDDKTVADEVIGTYKGTLSIDIAGTGATPVDGSILVTKASSDKINLSVKNFSLGGGASLGDIQVNNVAVTKSGSTYKLADTQASVSLTGLTADVALSSATIASGKLVLTIDVANIELAGTAVDYTVDVSFEGNKE